MIKHKIIKAILCCGTFVTPFRLFFDGFSLVLLGIMSIALVWSLF